MTQHKIDRINELSRKSRISPLSNEELDEQKLLRAEFRASFVTNLTTQLNNIDIVEADGTITPLSEKAKEK